MTKLLQLPADQRSVAQASKPAVSPISKSAGGRNLLAPRRLETCDTADLEICATALSTAVAVAGPGEPPGPRLGADDRDVRMAHQGPQCKGRRELLSIQDGLRLVGAVRFELIWAVLRKPLKTQGKPDDKGSRAFSPPSLR